MGALGELGVGGLGGGGVGPGGEGSGSEGPGRRDLGSGGSRSEGRAHPGVGSAPRESGEPGPGGRGHLDLGPEGPGYRDSGSGESGREGQEQGHRDSGPGRSGLEGRGRRGVGSAGPEPGESGPGGRGHRNLTAEGREPGDLGSRALEAEGSAMGARLPGAVLGVGVALPGPLDHRRGVLHRVTGFPEWNGFPLRDVLARRLSLPVVVDKDTNAAALGLAVGGEAASVASFAYLHFGAGVGGGLVIGGTVHRGARTGAGEFGHQVVQLDGPLCGCGNRGCVEALCLAAVERGDLAEAARVLGTAAGNLVALLDVDLVLLGGRTVAAAPETFVRGVTAVLDERARRAGEEAVPVRVASGGEREVAEGAAQLLLAPLFGRAEG
ncbi:ROK family protein [Streptomyces sp. M41]|uniref:ROK family protein n=1 Tax=Streptomyces sp. M41 TaxID=3059412 RepID=UPI00374D21D0